MKPIVPIEKLFEVKSDSNTVIVDARGGKDARERYKREHLENAVFIDLEKDLSFKGDPKFGGRHPLPDIEGFTKRLGELGISTASKIFIYDEKTSAMAAARFWWMMRDLGHEEVYVINGGLMAAKQAGYTITDKLPDIVPCESYLISDYDMPSARMGEVESALEAKSCLLIDVREAYRYNGESEPIDLIAGHIPGAINIPYTENLDAEGKFLTDNLLKGKYNPLLEKYDAANIICQCGSGVTACHTILALEQIGINGVKLYVGSWSEWSRNKMPMITKDE
ncbi:MAG: sulfurtransferase [Chitinophagales bacterium]